MNFIARIENVGHSFIAFQEKVVYITKNGDCIISSISGEKFKIINGSFAKLDYYSLSDFYLCHDFQSQVVDIKNYEIHKYTFMIQESDGTRNLCSNLKEGKRYFFSILKNGETEWEKQIKTGKFKKLFRNNFLNSQYLRDNILGLYSCAKGEEIWTFDTNTFGSWIDYDKAEKQTEVSKVLGELDNKLYVYLNNGKILIINLHSGEKLDVVENDKNTDQSVFHGRFMSTIQLDVQNNKLIQLFNQRYTEIDIQSKTVTQVHLEDMTGNNLSNMHDFVFDDHHICFFDQNECKIASLNRKTMQLDWVYALSDSNTCEIGGSRYGRNIKLKDNRLYVLDNKHTLHIFERQHA